MSLIIFLKQSFRSLKKNWNIVILFFLFLIVGVSLIVGLSSYLFNAYQLSVGTAFRNGSMDGEIDAQTFSWDGTDDWHDRNVVFTNWQRKQFKEIVGKPNFIKDKEDEDKFYSFLMVNNGYLQSFLYKNYDFETSENRLDFINWLNNLDWYKDYNGSALAYYFKQIIKKDIHPDWDVRTIDLMGEEDSFYSVSDDGKLKAYLPDEKDLVLSTFDERWIDFDQGKGSSPKESLFSRGDFTYHLRMSYEEYKEVEKNGNPVFLLEKNFRDFNLKAGDTFDISNTLLPVNAKNEKLTVVGDFVNAARLVSFSNKLFGAIPYTDFWDKVQSQANYLTLPFYITMNLNHTTGFSSRPQEIQKQIEASDIFQARDGPDAQLQEFVPRVAGQYHAVFLFWQVNLPVILLTIFAIAFLLFFVILFITNQLIENNKATLQFLKSMGLRNLELSSINMTLVLLPMVLAFLIAIPGFFLIQNLFSFILELQYPMILNFWMWNYATIFIFLGTVVFALAVFFLTNLTVLKRHNILEKRESKLVKRIKDGKIRNHLYNRVQPQTKIGLAIWGANLRKNLVTFGVLLVTFSVILFGVGFKGSIEHEGKLVGTTFLPFKSVSSVTAPLFSEQDSDNENHENQYGLAQELINEQELIDPANGWEIKWDPKDSIEDNIQNIANLEGHLKNRYITSKTIDQMIEIVNQEIDEDGDDGQKFLERLKEVLIERGVTEEEINNVIKVFESLYANYQVLKLQLEKVYNYDEDYDETFKFVFGRSVNPIITETPPTPQTNEVRNVGKILNLNVNIRQRFNNKIPPKIIRGFGLIDQKIKDVIGLNSTSSQRVDIKISQALATKLEIYKTELQFQKPNINFELSLSNDNKGITIPARIVEIIRADFAQDAIYYSFDNLKSYLARIPPSRRPEGVLGEQLDRLLSAGAETQIPNAYYIDGKIPNALLNISVPIVKGSGQSITNYVPNQESGFMDLQLLDFKIIGDKLVTETASYIYLVNRVIYIFLAITIIVSLLLTYLFLVENKKNILLFKSLGYSVREIATFLLIGYIMAAIVAAGLAIGISVLIISMLSNVFVELFNAIIPFAFTPFYSFLFVLLPVLFIILIFFSLWIYIFLQDPKRALDV